ncbi:MAG: TauD/TfdA family dioxygenase [Pseudobdellovibrionaceae bacterium]
MSQRIFGSFGALMTGKEPNKDLMSLDTISVFENLKESGALLFRDFDVNMDSFREFSDQFASEHLKHGLPKLRAGMSEDGTVADVLAGTHDIVLHGEMYYLPKQPDILWLFCQKPALHGGATTVCDGIEYLNALTPALKALFNKKKILYTHRWGPTGWQAIFKTDSIDQAISELKRDPRVSSAKFDGEFLTFDYVTSAIMRPKYSSTPAFINSIANVKQYAYLNTVDVKFEDGEQITPEMVEEINEIGSLVVKDVSWQAGDVLMIDNSRVMHGRRNFSGERKISTRFSKAS